MRAELQVRQWLVSQVYEMLRSERCSGFQGADICRTLFLSISMRLTILAMAMIRRQLIRNET